MGRRPPLLTPEFVPRVGLGDPVLLLGQTGFRSKDGTNLYEVVGIEGLTLLGQRGAILVWTQAAAAPAGFLLDSGAASGTIGAGSNVSSQAIQSLKNRDDEVSQVRFIPKVIGALPAGWVVHDYDLMIAQPGSTKRWGTNNVVGVLNGITQGQLPSDVIELPSQAANMTLPAAFVGIPPFDLAYRSELFIHRDEAPSFIVQNNGAVALNNAATCIAVVCAGIKYKIAPIASAGTQQVDKELLGLAVKVPNWITDDVLRWEVPILPVASRF